VLTKLSVVSQFREAQKIQNPCPFGLLSEFTIGCWTKDHLRPYAKLDPEKFPGGSQYCVPLG
jgi:hypothetical protein